MHLHHNIILLHKWRIFFILLYLAFHKKEFSCLFMLCFSSSTLEYFKYASCSHASENVDLKWQCRTRSVFSILRVCLKWLFNWKNEEFLSTRKINPNRRRCCDCETNIPGLHLLMLHNFNLSWIQIYISWFYVSDNALRGKLVVYDNVNQRIGWTSSDCHNPRKIKRLPLFWYTVSLQINNLVIITWHA